MHARYTLLHQKGKKRHASNSLWVGSICKQHACAVQALYCADPLIAALLASGAQHYLEFKLVQARYAAGALHVHAETAVPDGGATCIVLCCAARWCESVRYHPSHVHRVFASPRSILAQTGSYMGHGGPLVRVPSRLTLCSAPNTQYAQSGCM